MKFGTQVVTDDAGDFATTRMRGLINDLLAFPELEIVIVTSGAVGLGRYASQKSKAKTTIEKQAFAAIGQSRLMAAYNRIFAKKKRLAAQLLVTSDDLTDRQKYLNFSDTLQALLQMHAVPVINENDTVSTVELESVKKSFGDNDKLSALVAAKINADHLIILSNVDGIYTKNPFANKDARKLSYIDSFDRLKDVSTDGTSERGRGGFTSKLEAARVASLSGVNTIIANGFTKGILKTLLKQTVWTDNSPGTMIVPAQKISARKNWIGYSSNSKGILHVNDGAANAILERNSSLLSIGLIHVEGSFVSGDVVSIETTTGIEIAKGKCRMSSAELNVQIGQKGAIAVHRDDMVIFKDYQDT